MRPFALEVAEMLGWHDGIHTTVRAEVLDDEAVLAHESVHATLFSNTPDGSVARICLQANSAGPLAGSLSEVVTHWFENCRVAHESAATYIGVQVLSPEAHRERVLASFPAEYLAYYQNYADVIDAISPSTFLRTVFARVISNVIFSSRCIEEIVAADFDLRLASDARFAADRRQLELFAWLSAGGASRLRDLAIQIIREHPELSRWAAFDLHPKQPFGALDDDAHWEDSPLAGMAERRLINLLHTELCSAGPIEAIDSNTPEWFEFCGRMEPYLSDLGFEQAVVGEVDNVDFDDAGERYLSVLEVAAICIDTGNPGPEALELWTPDPKPTRLPFRADDGPFLFGVNISEQAFNGLAVVETWSEVDDDPEGEMALRPLAAFPRDALWGLKNAMYLRYQGAQVSELLYVVAPSPMDPIGSAVEPGLFELLHSLSEVPDREGPGSRMQELATPVQLITDAECFWYAARGWPDLIARQYPQPPRVGWAQVTSSEQAGLLMNVLQIPGWRGTFVKATPLSRSSILMEYYRERIAAGDWIELDRQQDREIFEGAAHAVNSCCRYWSVV